MVAGIGRAHLCGFLPTALPLVRARLGARQGVSIALDTVAITIMELIANRYMIGRGRGHAVAHGYH